MATDIYQAVTDRILEMLDKGTRLDRGRTGQDARALWIA